MTIRLNLKHMGAALAGLILAAALGLSAGSAFAQQGSPPNPPSRFAGSVTVNGQPAAAGTTVEARINGVACGTTTVFMSGAEARYVLDSPAADAGAGINCGTDGASVAFFVGGVQAGQTGAWHNYQLNTLNLTVSAATTPTATATTPGTTAVPATSTPRAPVTGSGVSSQGGATLLLPALAAIAIALGGAGAAVALSRKRR